MMIEPRNGIMNLQRQNKFDQMDERDREIQASFWALLAIVSENVLAFKAIMQIFSDKGVLEQREEDQINEILVDQAKLLPVYQLVESVFQMKYQQARYSMDHPEEMQRALEKLQEEQPSKQQIIDPAEWHREAEVSQENKKRLIYFVDKGGQVTFDDD